MPSFGTKPTTERQIVEEEMFTRQREALGVSCRILDEAWDEVGLALCRRPDLFPCAPGTNLHRMRLNGYSRMPDLNVWFTWDDNTVSLRFIEKADGEE